MPEEFDLEALRGQHRPRDHHDSFAHHALFPQKKL